MTEPPRDRYGNDLTVWVIWTKVPRIGWVAQRHPYSPRTIVEEHAEAGRRFLVSCGMDVEVEVRNETDGPPAGAEL